jgi:hypothetical protein
MSKLVFQFGKNEYKKTCNILKNGFTKFIFKNTKKKLFFFKAKTNEPNVYCHFFLLLQRLFDHILPPSQNTYTSESKELDVFGLKFVPNTFTFVDQPLIIFWDGGSI